MSHKEMPPYNTGKKNNDEEGEEEATHKITVKDNLEVITEELDKREKKFNEEHGLDHASAK